MVVTLAPSAWAASIVHDLTDSPFRRTVHAPHDDVSQPTFVPVSAHASRRYCTSSVRGSTSWSCAAPLTVIPIFITPALCGYAAGPLGPRSLLGASFGGPHGTLR